MNPGALYGTNKLEKLGTATVMGSRNPTIVRILEEKGSVIENRHSGIPTMKREMKEYNLPAPEFYEERGSFKVIFRNHKISGHQSGHQNKQKVINLKEYKVIVLKYCTTAKTAREIRNTLKMKSRQYVSSHIIKPLIEEGKLEYTDKKNIHAKNQKYITTK